MYARPKKETKKEKENLSGNRVSTKGHKYADLQVSQSETPNVRHYA